MAKSKTSIPYDPMGAERPEQQVGKLFVKGNDSWATVSKKGLVRAAVKDFDNTNDEADPAVPSAFDRAVAWAKANQPTEGGGPFG